MKTTPKRVNRAFNTLAKMPTAANKMTSDSHYSVERDRGTVKAEAITGLRIVEINGKKRLVREYSDMPKPPRKYNGPFTRSA